MKTRRPKLWLALRLPDLPLNALGVDSRGDNALQANREVDSHDDKSHDEKILTGPPEAINHTNEAILVTDNRRIIGMTAAAAAAGIKPGMNITTAQLLLDCTVLPRDAQREQQTLQALAEQLYRFTPYIEFHRSPHTHEAGLLLELSRCLKLFNGLRSLVRQITDWLANTPCHCCYGLAHTGPGAWLLSYRDYPLPAQPDAATFLPRLYAVPVPRLHDFPKAAEALTQMGFVTLGDVARQIEAQSMASLHKRFGRAFVQYLGQVFGIDHDFQQASLFDSPAPVFQPAEHFRRSLDFDYPVQQIDQLLPGMADLLDALDEYLRQRHQACQQIEWTFYDIDKNQQNLTVRCDQPQQRGALLLMLTRIRLEATTLPFAVDSLTLCCEQVRPANHRSQALAFNQTGSTRMNNDNDFIMTVARLQARLGDAAVFKVRPLDSHIPECTQVKAPPGESIPAGAPLPATTLRPDWLFDQPLPVEQRHQGLYWHGRLELIAGPERHEGHWWDTPIARDYFLAQREDHTRLWVFFDLRQQSWFVQGVF